MVTAKRPAGRRRTAVPEAAAKCPDCDGTGESTEAVRVGSRKGRPTADQQAGLCPTCWGSGEARTD
jgi:DnaJ-class molecular chaperone